MSLLKIGLYCIVGIAGTIAHYSILYALVEFYGFDQVVASGCGALMGMLINYYLNYSLTFKSRQLHSQALPKFAMIALLGLCLNLVLMAWLIDRFFYMYAQMITTAVVLIWGFWANSSWTFQMDISKKTLVNKPVSSTAQRILSGFGLVMLILTIRVITLGLYPFYDPSESRYAEMGRKMLETGNWVTPLFDYGVPFWGKPPLAVWMTASSLGLGGINEFAARMPSLLLSAATVWLVFQLATVQRDRAYAWNTVIILTSSVLFFVMAGTVAMDPSMCLGVALALVSFWMAFREDKTYWGYLFFIGLSIGVMAKGPIAIVLTGISLGLWTAITGAWVNVWQRLPWVKGTVLLLILSVPWFLIAEQKTPGFLEYFFIGEHWKRFTESGWQGDLYGSGHAKPRGMIWLHWMGGAFPWSLIFLVIFLTALVQKKVIELFKSPDNWRLYCLLWMLSPLVFFTFSANIIWTYVLPSLPGFALLLASWVNQSRYQAALALCVPLSFVGLVAAYQLSDVYFFRTQKPLVAAYQQMAHPDEHLHYLMDNPFSLQFYLHGKVSKLNGLTDLQQSLATSNHDFYVFQNEVLNQLPSPLKARIETIKHYGKFTLFQVRGDGIK